MSLYDLATEAGSSRLWHDGLPLTAYHTKWEPFCCAFDVWQY